MGSTLALLISALAAAIPTTLYVLVLWWFDRYEKEPKRLLLAAFVWGAVPAVILSVIAGTVVRSPLDELSGLTGELMSSSLLTPFVEEVVKGLAVLLLFLLFRHEFDDVLDGIIYGATIGFGFAMTENGLYFWHSLRMAGLQGLTVMVFLRTVVFGLNHALFTSVFGATLGHARMAKAGYRRWITPLLGLGAATTLHGFHNLFAVLSDITCFSLILSVISNWGGVLVIFVVIVLAWQQEKRWIATNLKAEVESGLLTQEDYDMIGSYGRRLAARWQAWSRHGRTEARRLSKLAQLATELAFKVEQGDERRAQRLREEIGALRSTRDSLS